MLLIGVGHLVGVTVGIAMLVGLIISWAFLVPHYTSLAGAIPPGTGSTISCTRVFVGKVRFIGAGTIGVAAIWTLLKIMGPIISGIRSALAANRERKAGRGEALPLTERDIPIGIVAGTILVLMVPIGLLLYTFASTNPIAANPGRDDPPQHRLHSDRWRRDRIGVRIHGRPHRRVQQSDFGCRHPVGGRHFTDPRNDLSARQRRSIQIAGRLCVVRHRCRVRRCHDLEQ